MEEWVADGKAGDTELQDGEPGRRDGKGERLGSGNEQSAKIGGCPGQRNAAMRQWIQCQRDKRLRNSQPWASNIKIQRWRAGQGIQYKLKSLRELGIRQAVAVLPEPETKPTQGGRPELQPPPAVSCDGRPGGPPNGQPDSRGGGGGVKGPTCADGPSHAVRNGHRPSGNPAPSAQALLSVPG